jgi:hypothetical protein
MSKIPKKVNAKVVNERFASRRSSITTELDDFKNVTNSLVQDALTVWADLWAELEGRVESEEPSQRTKEFEPSCGWDEYLEKMWVLKHYLDFVKRLSQL